MQLGHAGVRVGLLGRALRRSAPAFALCLTLAAAGCHVPGTSSPPGAGGQLTVAVVPGIDTAPLMIAVNDGLFRQQGLTVTLKQYSSVTQAEHALQKGTVDIAGGDYTSFFYAIAQQGAQLTLVMDGYDAGAGTMQVLTLPTSGIESPSSLQGKVVGTPAQAAPTTSPFPYNIETLAAQSVLQSDGVSPAAVNWRALPDSGLLSALEHHHVSAILATDPLIIQAETQLGAVEVFDACSGVTADLPLSGYFSTTAFAKQQGAALRAFRTALITAQTNAGMRSTVQSVLRSEHMTAQEAALVNIGQYPTFVNVGQVQRVADLMYDSGMISSPITVQNLLLK
jgi:NitT/TauT family transport system substrate-binding protein